MIPQGKSSDHQKSRFAKLGFLGKGQLNFDQAQLSHASSNFPKPKPILKKIELPTTFILFSSPKDASFRRRDLIHYRSFSKDTFFQGNLHQDEFFKIKNDQHRYCIGHLRISKKSNIIFKR